MLFDLLSLESKVVGFVSHETNAIRSICSFCSRSGRGPTTKIPQQRFPKDPYFRVFSSGPANLRQHTMTYVQLIWLCVVFAQMAQ
jgi:hypothetical protein